MLWSVSAFSCEAAVASDLSAVFRCADDADPCQACGPLPRRVLVTGGRNWSHADHVHRVLSALRTGPDPVLVHGDQGRTTRGRLVGLDLIAARAAEGM